MENRKYYEAYNDRYRQVHEKKLQWASDAPSAIVEQVLDGFGISKDSAILELGCGEGRDAAHLLRRGYRVSATDISSEAIRYCCEKYPEYSECFRVLDCVRGRLEEKFDFIYAVAVIHMLVEDADRTAFYSFVREHLTASGVALICTMGDGFMEHSSDISSAFEVQDRIHGETGQRLQIAGTSCRMVSWETFFNEIRKQDLRAAEHGITAAEPDFPVMMYAVVKKH